MVIKATAGFYYVKQGDVLWECALRGKFRLEKTTSVLVGDQVQIKPRHGKVGVIEKVIPRTNALVRPPVANVQQALMIFAVREPDIPPLLLDRFLVQASHEGIKPLICFNKIDLSQGEHQDLVSMYQHAGYSVLETSSYLKTGIELLGSFLQDKITVVAGPSGVGKSSLLNAVEPGFCLKTGEVGHKLKRGKHTTRHVELLPLTQGGWVADTPGFSQIWLPKMKREELAQHFWEIAQFTGQCRFRGCLHANEPDCAVKDAVNQGEIHSQRYENYLLFLEEIKKMETKY